MNRKDAFIIATLLLSNFVLRVYHLDYHNGETIFDERAYYEKAALSYLKNVDDPNFEHPPLGKEILALGIKWFGGSPRGLRMPPVIFSALGIAVVYLLFKELSGNRFMSTLAASLLSLDFMYFIHSRLGTMEIFYLFFTWTYMYFLIKFLKSGRIEHLLLGAVFFGLGLSTKWSAVLAIPPFVLILTARKDWTALLRLFVFLPTVTFIVYTLSYYPFISRNSFTDFIGLQLRIYEFWTSFAQKLGLKLNAVEYVLNHSYAWVLNPSWNYDSIRHGNGYIQLIWSMYNPIIFFPSLFLLVKKMARTQISQFLRLENLPALTVLAFYVPWLFVTSIQYTYYLLPAIPFLYSLAAEKLEATYYRDRWSFLSLALSVIFVSLYFYPLISDIPVPPQYLILYPLSFEN